MKFTDLQGRICALLYRRGPLCMYDLMQAGIKARGGARGTLPRLRAHGFVEPHGHDGGLGSPGRGGRREWRLTALGELAALAYVEKQLDQLTEAA